MAAITRTLRELRNADVQFISLVDRAASRIPFRVLKRDEGDAMIDLTRVFKGTVKPAVADIVVFAQKNDALAEKVRQSLADAGFAVDKVRKADDETISFVQGPQIGGDVALVRLSDQMVVGLRNFLIPEGWVGDACKAEGFLPGLEAVVEEFHAKTADALVTKGDVLEILKGFNSYLMAMASIPGECFKADHDLQTALEEAKKADVAAADAAKKAEEEAAAKKTEDEAAVAAAAKKAEEEAAAKGDTCKECGEKYVMKDGAKTCKCTKEEAAKGDISPVLAAIEKLSASVAAVTEQVTGITAKVDGVVQTQKEAATSLDGLAKKTDALEGKVAGIVLAPAPPEDRLRDSHRILKNDDDPRTGNFDTAFLRRSRR